jgi:capsular polysaccharide export protein
VAGASNALLFPHYRGHAPVSAPLEYAGYLWRLSRVRFRHSSLDAASVARLTGGHQPFFLLPLQLNSDAQIRDHSRFGDMGEVMEHVLESFARQAPNGTRLVIKNHPLDAGLSNHRRTLAALLARFGLAGRVDYLESGNLDVLLERARGCVTVNSTAGIISLAHGCPTVTLSDPIYNLTGLTFQGHLDDFWREGVKPDSEVFSRFRRVVMHTTQLNGGFYCRTGIALAVENSLPFLTHERSPLEALL